MICFALESESSPMRDKLRHQGEGALPFILLGNLGLHECLLIHTGMGAETARDRLAAALDHAVAPPSLLISAGFAGALDPALPAGHLFLARNATHPDLYEPSAAFLEDRGFSFATGRLHTSPQIIELPEEKARLARETGAQAIDMESSALADLCKQRGIPMVSLRVISDNATDPVPVPFSVCIDPKTGVARPIPIALHLLLHPWRIRAFLQFAKTATRSRSILAEAIAQLLPVIQTLRG